MEIHALDALLGLVVLDRHFDYAPPHLRHDRHHVLDDPDIARRRREVFNSSIIVARATTGMIAAAALNGMVQGSSFSLMKISQTKKQ